MFKRLTKIATAARPVLQTTRLPARNFCIYAAYLDPKAHVTMSHNPQNVYEDIVMLGDYLTPTRGMTREVSQKYIPQLLQITFDHLNAKYPNAKLTAENYEEYYLQGWSQLGIENIDNEKTEILEKFAEQIYVTEHKLRYPLEQRIRLSYTTTIFSNFNLAEYKVGFFFDAYNSWLNLDTDRSHLFRAPKIKGDTSFLEKYLQDQVADANGVEALQRDTPENKTFINRFMNFIHS